MKFIKKEPIVAMITTMMFIILITTSIFANDSVSHSTQKSTAEKQDQDDLAKASQNPIANMATLPIQVNLNFDAGPSKRMLTNVNIQPVFPVKIGKETNLINRVIIPLNSVPTINRFGNEDRVGGIGDINYSGFIVPPLKGNFMIGYGPTITLPTASKKELGAGKIAAGPAVVAVYSKGKWVLGGLANNQWSFAGDGNRPDTNTMLIQPFINYNLPKGWAIGTAPLITANWKAENGEQWTVPLGLSISKVFNMGNQPAKFSIGAYLNVVRPTNAPKWQLQTQFILLFPQR